MRWHDRRRTSRSRASSCQTTIPARCRRHASARCRRTSSRASSTRARNEHAAARGVLASRRAAKEFASGSRRWPGRLLARGAEAGGGRRRTVASLRDELAADQLRVRARHVHDTHQARRALLSAQPLRCARRRSGDVGDHVEARPQGRARETAHAAARRFAPGWVADDWIKWLTMIEVRPDEPKGFWYESGYRFPVTPGKPGEAVPADQMKPMTRLPVKSLIGSLSPGDSVPAGVRALVGGAM